MPPKKIKNAKVSIAWKSFHFNVPNFKDLPTTRDHFVETPLFTCNGHEWSLDIYPGGDDDAPEGYVSIDLTHHSEGSITANYEFAILDKFGKQKIATESSHHFEGKGDGFGWRNVILRSDILDESQNILDGDGTLTAAVSMKEEPSDVFVPKNPLLNMIQGMFLDEDTADVCFEVISSADAKKGKKKRAKASDLLHAHYCILK
ncbi:hypothetical protein ACHAWC_001050, partial [Mediolabrus comicus]